MFQHLQNNAPPYNGKGDIPEVEALNVTFFFHRCSFQGSPVWGQGNMGVSSSFYLCGYAAASSAPNDGRWKLS